MARLNDSQCEVLVSEILEELYKSCDRFEIISKFFSGNGSWQYKLGSLIEFFHGAFDGTCFICGELEFLDYDEFHYIFKCKDKFYKLIIFLDSCGREYDYSNFIIDEVKPVEKMIISYESVEK
jgi:hypothetical protein